MADSMYLGFLAAYAAVVFVIGLAGYIYTSFALMTIGKKLNYDKSWFAWIPIANLVMMLQLAEMSTMWLLILIGMIIPIVNVFAGIALLVIFYMALWKIADKRNFPGWTVLLALIPGVGGIWLLVLYGILAWKD